MEGCEAEGRWNEEDEDPGISNGAQHREKEVPEAARMEFKNLLNDLDVYTSRLEGLLRNMEEKLEKIPYIDNLLSIKGIGIVTVSGFIAEVGEIGRFAPQTAAEAGRICHRGK